MLKTLDPFTNYFSGSQVENAKIQQGGKFGGLGIEIEVGAQVATVQHAYTHFRITLYAFHARHLAGEPQSLGVADWRWVMLDELDAYPFSVTDRKIIGALRLKSN